MSKTKVLLIFGLILTLLVSYQGWISAATVFSDNFDDGNANGWTTQNGSWSVVQDSGSYVYYQSSTSEGRAYTGNSSWTNYAVQARVKVDNFNGSNRAYVCARYKDGNNYYAASLYNSSGGKLEIRKKVGGSSSTLTSKNYSLTTGTWYTVKLEVNGSTLKMYVNGNLELTATDSNLTSGGIGLIAYKAVVKYDDVLVDDLAGGSTPTPTPTSTSVPTPTPTSTIKPTPTPTQGVGTIFQAEDAYIYHGVVANNHSGYTGTGFVDYTNETGSYVEWTVNMAQSGNQTLTFRYANGTTDNRSTDIYVNGSKVVSNLAFNGTGAWTSWSTQTATVYLNSGGNTIRATATTSNGGPNIDYLQITGGAGQPTPTQAPTPTPTATIAPTPTATGIAYSGYYQVRNVGKSSMYIDGMGRTDNGSDLGQWGNTTHYNSYWELIKITGNYYQLKNRETGLFIDGMGRTSSGSICGQWANTTSENSHWEIIPDGNNVRFKNRASGLYLDGNGTTTNGDNVVQTTSSSSANQRWTMISMGGVVPTPTPQPTATPVPTSTPVANGTRQMENLDRGVVAVKVSNGVFVSWRMLGTEPTNVSYNLYRGSTKVNSAPITGGTNFVDLNGTTGSTYTVRAIINGVEYGASPAASVWSNNYLQIPLQVPSGGKTPDGVSYTYSANDCSVGDLDGDGKYEIVVKWDPSNSKDNSQSGYTGNVYLDAYTLTGTRLWRIDLGINIRAGAHYTQFIVYDLDGDGKAEVACKTADGTKDGRGTVIGDGSKDYRNSSGYILSGPEYLTIFEGQTGRALKTVNYEPSRGNVSDWGDSYGNRVDRFLACVAYLDGKRPSLVMCRGYYTRSVLVAYDWRNGSLTKRWTFDTNNGYSSYAGQGCHSLSVADVDNDGKDEIIYGACAIDDNGKGLYNTGLKHGDALHVSDFDPGRQGLEVWQCHENSPYGCTFRDARTGAIIFRYTASSDTGRACAGDITATYRGAEVWGSGGVPLASSTGQNLGNHSLPINFMIWWDGDLLRELLDGTTISKYGSGTLLSASGCASNNGSKANPCLTADILGDWREEAIWRTSDSKYLRIYTTTATTNHRIYTLMHDPVYRLSIVWQNVAYNQPPHTGFYLGDGMAEPPRPDIYLAP